MPTAEGFAPIAHPQDTQAQRNYTQRYTYDPVGNILRMKHESGMSVVWQRGYAYHPGGNQLKATSDRLDDIDDPLTYSVPYSHDAHGNMTAMPTIPGGLTWDDDDRLQSSDSIGGGKTYYVYDGAGQRVRKVHVNQTGSTSQQRLYFGSWETYREHKNINTTNDLDLERETLHVHDDHGRVCLIETKTVDAGTPVVTPANVARYQYSNHLGTANLELDDVAEVISYEEFHPYGTSSYRAANSAIEVSAKRYRYTGQERDEETGLAYHSARYYAPWLARWTAADPIGLAGGANRYAYVRGRPTVSHDPTGTDDRGNKLTNAENKVAELAGWTPEQLKAAQEHVTTVRAGLDAVSTDILSDSWDIATELPSIAVDVVKEELLGKIPGYSQVQDARDAVDSVKEFREKPGFLTGSMAAVSVGSASRLPFAKGAKTALARLKGLRDRIRGGQAARRASKAATEQGRAVPGNAILGDDKIDPPGVSPSQPLEGTTPAPNRSHAGDNNYAGRRVDGTFAVSVQRRTHILDGDLGDPGSGHGPRRESRWGAFPDSWDDPQAIAAVERVANSPSSTWKQSTGPGWMNAPVFRGGPHPDAPTQTKANTPVRFKVRGRDHGLDIEAIVEPQGEGIVSGYNRFP